MAKEHIIFDKTELVVAILGGPEARMENVKYSDVINVTFRSGGTGLFAKGEAIEIKTKRTPIVFEQKKEKKFWDGYKDGLRKFCKDNRITLNDETK